MCFSFIFFSPLTSGEQVFSIGRLPDPSTSSPGWGSGCSLQATARVGPGLRHQPGSSHPARTPGPGKGPELPSTTRQGWGEETPCPRGRPAPSSPLLPAAPPSNVRPPSRRVSALGTNYALLPRYHLPLAFGENCAGLGATRTSSPF